MCDETNEGIAEDDNERKEAAAMNSPAARKNATRQTNRAAMRITMATLECYDCGAPPEIAVPMHDRRTGRPFNRQFCLECSTDYSRDAVEELLAMLESID